MTNWEKLYQERTMTAAEAVSRCVENDDHIFVGGLTTAVDTVKAVWAAAKHGERRGLTLHGNMLLGDLAFTEPDFPEDVLRYRCFFAGGLERAGAKARNVSFVPLHLSAFGRYMEHIQPDVAVVPMTPPDEKGYCNLGPQGFNPTPTKLAKRIIAQITPALPRVYGSDHDFHVSQIAAFVLGDEPVQTIPSPPPTEIDTKIASYIVDMIPDGACFQLGIGSLANAVGFGLKSKKHLGVHSEMYTESMAVLQEAGIIDNSRKTFMPGRSIAGFALGTKAQYDYLANNPKVYFTPYEYVNDIQNIMANDNMISINNALAVDLTGQVCAESIGFRQYSGSGGQVDYIRGATRSKGGKSFLAFPSTVETRAGKRSRIVLSLEPGSVVTSLRAEVQYMVTEYGCVNLQFCDIPTRAKRLISIAHPEFREALTHEAKEAGYIY
ncbi:MAG: hypothetical protein FWC72_06475 [Oscillospiraceae bacterium]|nr:hypothetical protein [Oscillospiraceae bacterium]